ASTMHSPHLCGNSGGRTSAAACRPAAAARRAVAIERTAHPAEWIDCLMKPRPAPEEALSPTQAGFDLLVESRISWRLMAGCRLGRPRLDEAHAQLAVAVGDDLQDVLGVGQPLGQQIAVLFRRV